MDCTRPRGFLARTGNVPRSAVSPNTVLFRTLPCAAHILRDYHANSCNIRASLAIFLLRMLHGAPDWRKHRSSGGRRAPPASEFDSDAEFSGKDADQDLVQIFAITVVDPGPFLFRIAEVGGPLRRG